MKIAKDKINRILCIKLKGIGDVILSSVVFDNLRKDFPEATIDFLTEAPSKPALEGLPFINEIIVLDKKKKNSGFSIIWNIRKRNYDLILDFYSNPRTAMITFFSGAKYRAGFPYKGRNYAYNLFGPSERAKFHAAELHLEFLKKIGLSFSSDELYFSLVKEDISFAQKFFDENFNPNNLVIGISPSGGWPSKKCDPVKLAEIADAVINKFSARVLILWGPSDKFEAEETVRLMKNDAVMAPLTNIRQMGALISRCSLLIANDSGPMHISTAVKTPTLSLHGPTDPRLQGPFGKMHEWIRLEDLNCIGCNLLECPKKHECFLDLPLARVLEKIQSLIIKNGILFYEKS